MRERGDQGWGGACPERGEDMACSERGCPARVPRATRTQWHSHAPAETGDTPDLPREGTACSLGGLLEDLSIISMRFLSFSVPGCYTSNGLGGRHCTHAWIYRGVYKYLHFFFFFFLIYNYIPIRSFLKINLVCFYSQKETSQFLWVLMKFAKWGGWGGGCSKAMPQSSPGRSHGKEKTTWERRWKKGGLPSTQLLGAAEGWGGGRCYLSAAGNTTVCCPFRLQPFLLSQFKGALKQTEGFHRQSRKICKMEKKPKTSHVDQECWVEGRKIHVKRVGGSKLYFQALC